MQMREEEEISMIQNRPWSRSSVKMAIVLVAATWFRFGLCRLHSYIVRLEVVY
jgi:hypothetical protein